MRGPLLVLAGLAVSLSLAACGQATSSSSTDKFKGEQKAVAQVVEDLQSAGESKDAEKICNDIISRTLVAQVKAAGSDCAAEMKTSIDDADDFDLQVQRVAVNGNSAQAEVKGKSGGRDRTVTFDFVKENGGWRASSLGAR